MKYTLPNGFGLEETGSAGTAETAERAGRAVSLVGSVMPSEEKKFFINCERPLSFRQVSESVSDSGGSPVLQSKEIGSRTVESGKWKMRS